MQKQIMKQTQAMRLNQFQQQSLHLLQSSASELLEEVEEFQARHPELQWKDGKAPEWQQGDDIVKARRHYPGEWRLDNQWQNGRFLSAEQLERKRDNKQQMLENFSDEFSGEEEGPDLRETLREQIYAWRLSAQEREFCELVLQNLDERGLNIENPMLIAKALFSGTKATKTLIPRLGRLLRQIQELEPTGCACDSALHSLLVQARLRFADGQLAKVLESLPSLEMLGSVEDFLAYIQAQGQSQGQGQSLSEQAALRLLEDLRTLEPYPARGYRVSKSGQNFRIYPEIQVAERQGGIEIQLLNQLGVRLMIAEPQAGSRAGQENRSRENGGREKAGQGNGGRGNGGQEKAEQAEGKAALTERQEFLRKRRESQFLLENLQRREQTLLQIAEAIFQLQSGFVRDGIKELQVMNLEMLAEQCNLHASTISRCIQGKYCKTPWGTYPLRFFLTQGARSGQSREQIKERMVEILQDFQLGQAGQLAGQGGKPAQKKLSDTELNKRLEALGIQVARRTVALYRSELRREGRI